MSVFEVARPASPERAVKVTDADVLTRAADLLEEFGWCQYDLGSKEKGHFCALGAINAAVLDVGAKGRDGAMELLRRSANMSPGIGIVRFNNAEGRTRDEVVAKLREAAAFASTAHVAEGDCATKSGSCDG